MHPRSQKWLRSRCIEYQCLSAAPRCVAKPYNSCFNYVRMCPVHRKIDKLLGGVGSSLSAGSGDTLRTRFKILPKLVGTSCHEHACLPRSSGGAMETDEPIILAVQTLYPQRLESNTQDFPLHLPPSHTLARSRLCQIFGCGITISTLLTRMHTQPRIKVSSNGPFCCALSEYCHWRR